MVGPKWLLDKGSTKPDFAIAAGFSYAVVTAHNGCLHLEVTVHGQQAHAAMPETGVDALEAATDDARGALRGARPPRAPRHRAVAGIDSPKLNVGLIAGGINTNVVPDRVMMRLDRRIIPEENRRQGRGGSAQADRRRAGEAHPASRSTVRRIMLAVPLKPLPGIEHAGRRR